MWSRRTIWYILSFHPPPQPSLVVATHVFSGREWKSWRVVDMFKWMRLFWGPTHPPYSPLPTRRSVFWLMDKRYTQIRQVVCCFMFPPSHRKRSVAGKPLCVCVFPDEPAATGDLAAFPFCSPFRFPFLFLFFFLLFNILLFTLSFERTCRNIWIDTRQQCRPTTLVILFNHTHSFSI